MVDYSSLSKPKISALTSVNKESANQRTKRICEMVPYNFCQISVCMCNKRALLIRDCKFVSVIRLRTDEIKKYINPRSCSAVYPDGVDASNVRRNSPDFVPCLLKDNHNRFHRSKPRHVLPIYVCASATTPVPFSQLLSTA